MNIGLAIKLIRKKININQYELAKQCGISQTSLSQIENGIKQPSHRTLTKVSNALDIPQSVFYILAMQETDVPENRKRVYNMLFPSIRSLALEIISDDHKQYADLREAV